MDDLLGALPKGGGWSILAVFLILVFGAPAVFSRESLQNKFGGIRLITSWWNRREAAAIEQEAELERVVESTLRGQMVALRRTVDEQREDYQAQIGELRASFERREAEWRTREVVLQDQVSQQVDYIGWVANWARQVHLWAKENGHTLPPPLWMPYHIYTSSVHHPREPPAEDD